MPNLTAVHEAIQTDEEPVRITINDRLGEPYKAHDGTDAWIEVLGSESRAYRAAEKRANRRMLKGRRMRRSDLDVLQARVEKAAGAVSGWHPEGWWEEEDADGEPAAFLEATPENVRRVLSTEHILAQVEEAIHDHEAFFRSASADSSRP